MDRRLPWALIASWLAVGAFGYPAAVDALEGHSSAVVAIWALEAGAVWAGVWIAILVPRITTLTVARIGVPTAGVAAGVVMFVGTGESLIWPVASLVAAMSALATLALPTTIDCFVDGSSYGPERRFALRTPPLTALVAIPPTWLVAVGIIAVPPLAVSGQLVAALVLGIAWVLLIRWAVRSLHLPARRWVVFVPAGMVLSDPLILTDRVLFPRRNVEAIGPADASTDATDFSQGALGLAVQLDLSEPFAIPMIDRRADEDRDPSGERTVTVDRIIFAVLRPGAMLELAGERRFTVGQTRPAEPQCVHHLSAAAIGEMVAGSSQESQTAVPLPRTRSSR